MPIPPSERNRFVLIGPTPPPLGGISVYISRHTRQLRAAGNTVTNVDVAGARGFGKLFALGKLVLDPRPAEFQLHAFDFTAMGALLLRPFRKEIVYMDHGTPLYARELRGLRRFILGRIFQRADRLSFVSEEGIDHYRADGFRVGKNATVQSAFLPPPFEDEQRILAGYSPSVIAFIDEHSPLVVANASQIIFYDDTDLYGLDLCVELFARLRAKYPRIGFVFAVADDAPNRAYTESTLATLNERRIGNDFLLLTGQQEIWPLFRKADVMVRPTSNDGYAISLEEAIFCGCTTVASDAAVRPAATKLFRNRDLEDFVRVTQDTLGARSPYAVE